MSESEKEESKHSGGELHKSLEKEDENFNINMARFSSGITPKIQRLTKAETKEEKLIAIQK